MSTKTQQLTRGIYRRGKIYWFKFQRAGKRLYISLETSDALEAVRRAEEMRSVKFPDQTQIVRGIDDYLAEKQRRNIYGRATARMNGAVLREFARRVETLPLDAIKPKLAAEHYRALQSRVAETTAQIHIRVLRAFFNWCVKKKLCRVSPCKDLILTKIDQPARIRFCTREQREAFLNEAQTDDLRFIFFCGFSTGMRKNEIIEARTAWFDLPNGAVHLQNTPTFRLKDREARTIPLTARFTDFLRGYLRNRQPNDFALRPDVAHGKAIYRYDFIRPFMNFMKARDLRWVTPHVMRHTFASLLAQAGVSIYKVARWMGDGVEVVEKHYGHLSAQDSDIERAE